VIQGVKIKRQTEEKRREEERGKERDLTRPKRSTIFWALERPIPEKKLAR